MSAQLPLDPDEAREALEERREAVLMQPKCPRCRGSLVQVGEGTACVVCGYRSPSARSRAGWPRRKRRDFVH